MEKRCLWCLESEPNVTFLKKAHTIPKSLGGQNFNQNICDDCNEFFGNRKNSFTSIEEALKETFNITRQRILLANNPKRKVGPFKSKYFDIKDRNGKKRLIIKSSFRFDSKFQTELCRSFKRGLYKMFFEEFNRQKGTGYENKYDIIRKFSRYNEGDLPVYYFIRSMPVMLLKANEGETPILFFERMNYLYNNDSFAEIEFLGHVFGFPITQFEKEDLIKYQRKSFEVKEKFFRNCIKIEYMTDVDFTLQIMND